MNRLWPLFLMILTTAAFVDYGPKNLDLPSLLAQSMGYSVLVFICVYATLAVISAATGMDFGLYHSPGILEKE